MPNCNVCDRLIDGRDIRRHARVVHPLTFGNNAWRALYRRLE